jgi:hypothetical protein
VPLRSRQERKTFPLVSAMLACPRPQLDYCTGNRG